MMKQLQQFASAKIDPDKVGIPTVKADSLLQNVLDLVYFFGGVVAVVVIVIAGIMYATSNGESEGITRAKNMILYAVVGLVVILMAFVITGFVIGRF